MTEAHNPVTETDLRRLEITTPLQAHELRRLADALTEAGFDVTPKRLERAAQLLVQVAHLKPEVAAAARAVAEKYRRTN